MILQAHGWLATIADRADTIGFDYGHTRISLYRAILAVVVLVAVIMFGRIAARLIRALFGRLTNLDPAQQLLGEKLVSISVWIMTILIGIDVLGISLTALTVFSGALGLAVGFGLQKTFGNLIAGIILLMDRSIKPGVFWTWCLSTWISSKSPIPIGRNSTGAATEWRLHSTMQT